MVAEFVFPPSLYVVGTHGGKNLATQGLVVRDDQLEARVECVPIFSEQLLAERWINLHKPKATDDVAIGVFTLAQMAAMLRRQPQELAVVMDPAPDNTKGSWVWSMAETIAQLDRA